jgi:hypothetical protein
MSVFNFPVAAGSAFCVIGFELIGSVSSRIGFLAH